VNDTGAYCQVSELKPEDSYSEFGVDRTEGDQSNVHVLKILLQWEQDLENMQGFKGSGFNSVTYYSNNFACEDIE
jgi:hypothetical protein